MRKVGPLVEGKGHIGGFPVQGPGLGRVQIWEGISASIHIVILLCANILI